VAQSDLAVIISDFAFDPKSGRLTKFERDSALNALNQLRELHGFKAAPAHENNPSAQTEMFKGIDIAALRALQAALREIEHSDSTLIDHVPRGAGDIRSAVEETRPNLENADEEGFRSDER
jgi:hypothetical protein